MVSVLNVHINICVGQYTPLIPALLVQTHETRDIAGHLLAEVFKVNYTIAQIDLQTFKNCFRASKKSVWVITYHASLET